MAAIANLTVKKADGTTDIVYTAKVPSAGDKSAALWRSDTVGTAPAHKPTFSLTSRNNGTGTARRSESSYQYPSLATGTDGKVNVVDRVVITSQAVVPQGMSAADIKEAVYQEANIRVQALIKDSIADGYAPT